MIKPDTLPQFLRNKVEENDAFGLVEGLCQLLRSSPTEKISPTLHLFKFILKNDKELGLFCFEIIMRLVMWFTPLPVVY